MLRRTSENTRSRVFVAFRSFNAALSRAIIFVPVRYDSMDSTPSIEKMELAWRGEELVQRRRSELDVPRAFFHLVSMNLASTVSGSDALMNVYPGAGATSGEKAYGGGPCGRERVIRLAQRPIIHEAHSPLVGISFADSAKPHPFSTTAIESSSS